MGFVAHGEPVTVTLAVVAYGSPPRLKACLDSLVAHESAVDFDVVLVLNPDSREGNPTPPNIPTGVLVVSPEANLGWAGGLQLARRSATGQWMAWIQDDSEVLPGWLDAQLRAGQTHPQAGALGAVGVDADGRPQGSGGVALPEVHATYWPTTFPHADGSMPEVPTRADWITSKGMLVRLEAWDDVGGTCARYYPLNRVDKEFSTHLRAHGWELYVVPDAKLFHLRSQSAPPFFRTFLLQWQNEPFRLLWDDAVRAMQTTSGSVEHPCHHHPAMADVEREILREASRMLVQVGWSASTELASEAQRTRELEAELAATHRTLSWRITAPLRWARAAFR